MNNTFQGNDLFQLETSIAKTEEVFKDILDFIAGSGSEEPHRVERELFKKLIKLGRNALQAYFDNCGTGDAGKNIAMGDGVVLKRNRRRAIDYISIFGKVEISRFYYWSKGAPGICPLDSELNLPDRAYSYHLQEIVTFFDVRNTYDESAKTLEKLFGLKISPRSIMDILQDVSREVEDFRDSQNPPPSADEKEILVVSVDGKGVPMRKEELAKNDVRLKKGEKRQKKKMCAVGAVYTIEKNVRSADDILKKKAEDDGKAPRPFCKRIRARLGDKTEKEKLLKKLRQEADSRNIGGDKIRVFLCDGERYFWSLKDRYYDDYIGVLDLYHVMERLWTFAYCFHPEGSGEAKDCVALLLRMLLEGNVLGCIEVMKAAGKESGLSKTRQSSIRQIVKYFRRNRFNMRYDEYLSEGIPIGSGNVESACKNLVKDRMEGAGMRWSKDGADAMLALRAVYLNGDLENYFEYYIGKQRKKLYGGKRQWHRMEVARANEFIQKAA